MYKFYKNNKIKYIINNQIIKFEKILKLFLIKIC